MKKTVVAILIAVVAVAAVAGVGVAYAKGPGGFGTTTMMGAGVGYGAAGGQVYGPAAQGVAPGIGGGILHDGIIAYFADALKIDVVALEARLDAGETMADIAVAEGLTLDEFQALMLEARTSAIAQAVVDGLLTQEQADWMSSRGFGRMGGGYGQGMRGAGQGQFANPNCPMYDSVQP